MKDEKKHTLQLIVAVVVVAFGCCLIGAAFWVDPTGQIDPTVLTAYGETLTFAGSVIGIDYRYRSRSTSGHGSERMPDNSTNNEP